MNDVTKRILLGLDSVDMDDEVKNEETKSSDTTSTDTKSSNKSDLMSKIGTGAAVAATGVGVAAAFKSVLPKRKKKESKQVVNNYYGSAAPVAAPMGYAGNMSSRDCSYSDLSPITQALITAALGTVVTAALTPVGEVLYQSISKGINSAVPKDIRSIKPSNNVRVPWSVPTPKSNIPLNKNAQDEAVKWIRDMYGDKPIQELINGYQANVIPMNYKAYVDMLIRDINPQNGLFNPNAPGPNTILNDYLASLGK